MLSLSTRKTASITAVLGLAAFGLVGCAGAGDEPQETVVGDATSYDSLEGLRDEYIAAGGECPEWEEISPGDYDAQAGRCSDSVVIAIYNSPAEMQEVIDQSLQLVTSTHLLVGENWIINTPEPAEFVDALGGTVVTG